MEIFWGISKGISSDFWLICWGVQGAHVWGRGSLADLSFFFSFPGFAFFWCTSFHASLSVLPEPYVFGLKGNMSSARKSWSQVPFYCREACKWCEEGERVWHLGLWEPYWAAAIEMGVSCQSCFPHVHTLVLICQLWANSRVERKQGMKEERFALCDLLAQAPLQGMLCGCLFSRCGWTGVSCEALCSGALWTLVSWGSIKCVTCIKLINLAGASGNRDE